MIDAGLAFYSQKLIKNLIFHFSIVFLVRYTHLKSLWHEKYMHLFPFLHNSRTSWNAFALFSLSTLCRVNRFSSRGLLIKSYILERGIIFNDILSREDILRGTLKSTHERQVWNYIAQRSINIYRRESLRANNKIVKVDPNWSVKRKAISSHLKPRIFIKLGISVEPWIC